MGRLFREFGIVVAGAVLISAFISLTLTPMMSARLLRRAEEENWLYRKTEPFFTALISNYNRSLKRFMEKRWLAIVIMVASIAIIFGIGAFLPSELARFKTRHRRGLRLNSWTPT